MRVAVIGSRGLSVPELPEYNRYGKAAPLYRNLKIIDDADCVLAFWDGKSRGTAYVIQKCAEKGKSCQVYRYNKMPGKA